MKAKTFDKQFDEGADMSASLDFNALQFTQSKRGDQP